MKSLSNPVFKLGLPIFLSGFLIFSINAANAAWTEPDCDPEADPGACSIAAPINTSGSAQTKTGGLTVGGALQGGSTLAITGYSSFANNVEINGYVGIGDGPHVPYQLFVAGDSFMDGNVGIGSFNANNKLKVYGSSGSPIIYAQNAAGGMGLYSISASGPAMQATGATYGGYFIANAGTGVYSTGTTYGGNFNASTGTAVNGTGNSYGGNFTASNGTGVQGTGTTYGGNFTANNTVGTTYAVRGTTNRTYGGFFSGGQIGSYNSGSTYGGYFTGGARGIRSSGTTYGVEGISAGTAGVYGNGSAAGAAGIRGCYIASNNCAELGTQTYAGDFSGPAKITNSDAVPGLEVTSSANDGIDVSADGVAVLAESTGGDNAFNGTSSGVAISAESTGNAGTGVYGNATYNNGTGVHGNQSGLGTGVYGSAGASGTGVHGYGGTGVLGESANSYGVKGETTNVFYPSVYGYHATGTGVYGESGGALLYGVYGVNTNSGVGVRGEADSTSFPGVLGSNEIGVGVMGTSQSNDENHAAVYGYNTNGNGVYAYSNSANRYALRAYNAQGTAIYAWAPNASATEWAFEGEAPNGSGVKGVGGASTGYGVYGSNNSGVGVYGYTANDDTTYNGAIYGYSSGNAAGVFAYNAGNGRGIEGRAFGTGYENTAVYGYNTTGWGIYCYGADCGGNRAWSNTSDERLKKDVVTIENPIEKVKKLRGVTYVWKDAEYQGTDMGFIAQEVLESAPEVVHQDDDGYFSMETSQLTALLAEAIKEQQKQIEALQEIVCEDHPEEEICK